VITKEEFIDRITDIFNTLLKPNIFNLFVDGLEEYDFIGYVMDSGLSVKISYMGINFWPSGPNGHVIIIGVRIYIIDPETDVEVMNQVFDDIMVYRFLTGRLESSVPIFQHKQIALYSSLKLIGIDHELFLSEFYIALENLVLEKL